jgi:NTP pyrophosphatase (non-canonical NTP hydrolase)
MNPSNYQKLAMRTECEQEKSRERFYRERETDPKARLLPVRLNHAVLGLAGEVGELAGAVEKWLYYGRELDRNNVKEELGDCCWRLAQACDCMGLDLGEVMGANLNKLKVRYPGGYTDNCAAVRDRKAEGDALGGADVGGPTWVGKLERQAEELNNLVKELESIPVRADPHDVYRAGVLKERLKEVGKELGRLCKTYSEFFRGEAVVTGEGIPEDVGEHLRKECPHSNPFTFSQKTPARGGSDDRLPGDLTYYKWYTRSAVYRDGWLIFYGEYRADYTLLTSLGYTCMEGGTIPSVPLPKEFDRDVLGGWVPPPAEAVLRKQLDAYNCRERDDELKSLRDRLAQLEARDGIL